LSTSPQARLATRPFSRIHGARPQLSVPTSDTMIFPSMILVKVIAGKIVEVLATADAN
jgi:hypothetical protein